MLAIKFDAFPTLETKRLRLRELKASDAAALYAIRTHPDVNKYLGREPDEDVHAVERLIGVIQQAYANGDGVHWSITHRHDDTLIGSVTYWNLDKQNYRAELGYLLSPACWRQGLMTEAIEAVLQFGFDEMKLHSVEANTSTDNIGSQKLLLNCGFKQEAHFRENWHFRGTFYDSLVFCKLANQD